MDPRHHAGVEATPPPPEAGLVWDLDLLHQVLSRPVSHVLKSIPAGARRQVATCMADLMRHIILHPLDEGAYVHLFVFPRAVLRCMPPENDFVANVESSLCDVSRRGWREASSGTN